MRWLKQSWTFGGEYWNYWTPWDSVVSGPETTFKTCCKCNCSLCESSKIVLTIMTEKDEMWRWWNKWLVIRICWLKMQFLKFVICKSWQHADVCDMKSGHICKATKVYIVMTADSSAVMSMRSPRTVALSAQSLAEYCLHLDHHYHRPRWHHHHHHHRHCRHRHEQLTVTPSGRKRSRFAWGMMKQSLPVEDFH